MQKRLSQPTGLPDHFARKALLYVRFMDNPGTVPDPRPDLKDPDDFNNPTNRPGRCAAGRLQDRSTRRLDNNIGIDTLCFAGKSGGRPVTWSR